MTGRRALEPPCESPALELSLGRQGLKVMGHEPSLAGDHLAVRLFWLAAALFGASASDHLRSLFLKRWGPSGSLWGPVTFAACESGPSLWVGVLCTQGLSICSQGRVTRDDRGCLLVMFLHWGPYVRTYLFLLVLFFSWYYWLRGDAAC